MRFHGRSTVHLELSYHVCTTKKTGTLTNVPPQPHARRHFRHRLKIPKKLPRLPSSQKHEQRPQENSRRIHWRPVDQEDKRYGVGVYNQVFNGTDGLYLR